LRDNECKSVSLEIDLSLLFSGLVPVELSALSQTRLSTVGRCLFFLDKEWLMWSSLTYCGERRPCVPERLLTNPVTAALLVFLGSSSCVMAQDPVEADESTQSQGVMILPSVTISGTRTADTTTTEGTGLYTTGQTTAATRLPLTLRETPQSVPW